MDASRQSLYCALLASCSTLLVATASDAIALDGAPQTLLTAPGGQCVRSPDVTFEGNSYYIAFVSGPCSGPGNHAVMIGRWNPGTHAPFEPILVWNQMLSEASSAPTVRVSSAALRIIVASVDRANAQHKIRTDFFDTNLSRPISTSMPLSTSGAVHQHSLDCATGAMPQCVLSTIESSMVSPRARVYAYFTPSSATPISLGTRMDQSMAIASVAGAPGQSAVAFVTNSTSLSEPHAMVATAPSGTTVSLGASRQRAMNGVAAMVVQDAVAAFWTVPSYLEFAMGPTWTNSTGLVSGHVTVTGAEPYFTIEDGAPVGNNALLVGRNSASSSNGESSSIALTSFVPMNGLESVPLTSTSITPKSPTRLAAARNHCPLYGTALAVYTDGASVSSNLKLQRLRCSMDSECVDGAGVNGACIENHCVFPVRSVCYRAGDAGIDTGLDAALDGAVNHDGTADASSADASSATDDASRADSASASDGNVWPGGSSMSAVTGGACGCRVGSAGSRDVRPLALGSLVVLAALARRRRMR